MDVYSSLVYEYCRSSNLQSSDAADVTQNVLLRVAKSIQRFEYDPAKGLFRDWLARIVINEIRRYAVKSPGELVDPAQFDRFTSVQKEWNDHFQDHLLQVALARSQPSFNESTWQMFELNWIQQIPAEEVAAKLGVGVEKVYVARCRVLKRLKSEIAFLVDDIP